MSNGFLTFAQNTEKTDYLRLAYACALSVKHSQKYKNFAVAVTPGQVIPDKYKEVFDEIIEIPWGDLASSSNWKMENEWKAFHISPFKNTLKIDCDMLFTNDISNWFDNYDIKTFMPCSVVYNLDDDIVTSDAYRETFVINQLPNVYSGCMFFGKNDISYEIYFMMECIFKDWKNYWLNFLKPRKRPNYPSTDLVLALALKLLDYENIVLGPHVTWPTFIHMKTLVQNWHSPMGEKWNVTLPSYMTNDGEIIINNTKVDKPLHYHLKDWLKDEYITKYERLLGI